MYSWQDGVCRLDWVSEWESGMGALVPFHISVFLFWF